MSVPVIIDCDPGHDDAVALLLALASPEIDLRFVTTVAGNTTLDKTTANARRVLDIGGSEIDVFAGCDRPLMRDLVVAEYVHGPSGLDGPTLVAPSRPPSEGHAVDAIAHAVEASADPITLVPVGPLTNVAVFLARYPRLADRLDRIVLMGGSMQAGNITASAEYNIYVGPEGAHRVFESGIPLTMIGLDVTHRALLRREDADILARAGAVGRFVAELFGFFRSHEPGAAGLTGAPIHDAAAVAHLIWPDLIRTERRPVTIDVGETCRGRTVVDLRPQAREAGAVDVAVDIDGARFTRMLVERLQRFS